jgi:hypothetical protein
MARDAGDAVPDRVSFATHKGVRVFCVDYSGLVEMPELLRIAERATRLIAKEQASSLLVLVDLTDTRYSLRLVRSLGELAAANARFVRARALVGLPALVRPVVREVARFSGRPAEMFDDRATALDWLAGLSP